MVREADVWWLPRSALGNEVLIWPLYGILTPHTTRCLNAPLNYSMLVQPPLTSQPFCLRCVMIGGKTLSYLDQSYR